MGLNLDYFPCVTKNSFWLTTKTGYWTGGFWIGLMWQGYKINKDEDFLINAYKLLRKLEIKKISKTFDLGFLFYPSFILGYNITEDIYLKESALEAANTLSDLFNEKIKFLYEPFSLDNKIYGKVLIDIMMNLTLLWWAFKTTQNKKYYDIAYSHSLRTIEELIRKDHSTIQGLLFDLNSNKIIKKGNFQGMNDLSCWSRGQAWGLYGFILAHKYTKELLFLKTAENLAKYFISKLPEDYVPYWDFNVKEETDLLKDSSAGAIASSGLLEIAKYSKNKIFEEYSIKILNSLSSNYLKDLNEDGILSHGCFHKPKNLGINESLIWGDYYFVEALAKITKK